MAYRFNPPPNWPIDEPNWTPPEDWQPDPAWGPAPEGWDFWINDEAQSAETQVTPTASERTAVPEENLSPLAPAPEAAEPASPYSADDYGYGNTGEHAVGSASQSAGTDRSTESAPVAPAYGSSSLPTHEAPSWQSAASGAEPPAGNQEKGVIARFWWVGCILLVLLAFLIGAIGLIASALMGKEEEPQPSPSTSTSASPDPSTDPSASSSPSTGGALPGPTPGPNAQTKEVTTYKGKGKVTISTQWVSNAELSKYGDYLTPAPSGQYLLVIAKVETTEGEMFFNPGEIVITTPYGGTLNYAPTSFSMKNNGINSISDIPVGTSASMGVLYDVKKVDGLVLTWGNDKTGQKWQIPSK